MSGAVERSPNLKPDKDLQAGAGENAALSGNGNFEGRPHPVMGGVYFITDGANIKIGYSGAPTVRLNDLQHSSAKTLTLLGVIAGTFATEGKLHMQFQHARIRGEWFRPTRDLLSFIERECGGGEALCNLKPPRPAALVAKRLGVSEATAEAYIALSAWAEDKSEEIKNIVWVTVRQLVTADQNPHSQSVRWILARNINRLAAR